VVVAAVLFGTVQNQLTKWIVNQAWNILSFKVVILNLGLNNIQLKRILCSCSGCKFSKK